MNTDIRLSVSFRGHRKRKRLRIVLGEDGTRYLIDLWIAAAVDRPDGVLLGLDEVDIALMAEWEGDPATFVDALVAVGFLDRDESGTYSLHDWAIHNGYASTAAERSEAARVAAQARWRKERGVVASQEPVAEADQEVTPAVSPAPPARPRAFTPPGLAEVEAYCRERGGLVDPQTWYDFYLSKGWMVGKSKMKDWRACVRTWEKDRDQSRASRPRGPSPSSTRLGLDALKGGGRGAEGLGRGNGAGDAADARAFELKKNPDGGYSA